MSLSPYVFVGRTAVLTGAAGGIGEQLAYGLAGRGSDLVLLDRDGDGLERVAGVIADRRPARTVQTVVVDLSDRDATEAAAREVLAGHPRIGLLINNAGVALGGNFEHLTVEEFEWVMDINFRAPLLLTHHLLPALLAEPGGHLVNMSSVFGLMAPPGQTAYAASKFALRGLSQALRAELAGRVGVTTVHPGGIRTNIAKSARIAVGAPQDADVEAGRQGFDRLLSYPPEKAAVEILAAVQRRRARLLIAASAKLPDVLVRLFPAGHMRVLGALTSGR